MMDDLADFANKRFFESIATNPTFYYGLYSGTIARNAGFAFMGRFLSNHSVDYPLGGHLSTFTTTSRLAPLLSPHVYAYILIVSQPKRSSAASSVSPK